MLFLVRLFPEITIKSPPVRKRLTRFLTENLRVLIRRIHPRAKVKQDWDKLEVRIPSDDEKLQQEVADLLGRAFGGSATALVTQLLAQANPDEHELNEIRRTIREYQQEQ